MICRLIAAYDRWLLSLTWPQRLAFLFALVCITYLLARGLAYSLDRTTA